MKHTCWIVFTIISCTFQAVFGCDIVNCLVAPCSVSKCEAYPNAECRDNYCGGCFADYYVNGNKVNCTLGCNPNNCSACSVKKCKEYPYAKCVNNGCNGGCRADFYVNGKKVNCKKAPKCKKGYVDCFIAPCNNKTCASYPNAVCYNNYCGGCFADFYVDGFKVDCNDAVADI